MPWLRKIKACPRSSKPTACFHQADERSGFFVQRESEVKTVIFPCTRGKVRFERGADVQSIRLGYEDIGNFAAVIPYTAA